MSHPRVSHDTSNHTSYSRLLDSYLANPIKSPLHCHGQSIQSIESDQSNQSNQSDQMVREYFDHHIQSHQTNQSDQINRLIRYRWSPCLDLVSVDHMQDIQTNYQMANPADQQIIVRFPRDHLIDLITKSYATDQDILRQFIVDFSRQSISVNTMGDYRVDHLGYRVDPSGYRIDPLGYHVDHQGYHVDHQGYRVDPLGYRVDHLGYRVDHLGYRVDSSGYCVDHMLVHTPDQLFVALSRSNHIIQINQSKQISSMMLGLLFTCQSSFFMSFQHMHEKMNRLNRSSNTRDTLHVVSGNQKNHIHLVTGDTLACTMTGHYKVIDTEDEQTVYCIDATTIVDMSIDICVVVYQTHVPT